MKKILCIVGPTSSGKTALSVELAKQFSGEIVNADARQVYRGFTIGTGKPSADEQQGIPHHLFDHIDPNHNYSVAEWKQETEKCIDEIIARGHLPIVVGGTGLYLRALIDDLQPPASVDPTLRDRLQTMSDSERLQLLQEKDPASFEKIDTKNPRRVLRALEVALSTGRSFVEQQAHGPSKYDALQIAIDLSRPELYRRIDTAVDRMLSAGWLDEVRHLHDLDEVPWDAPAMTSIGYRELGQVIQNKSSLPDAVQKIKQLTRNYAKRQLTWFRHDERVKWIKNAEEAAKLLEKWLKL